VTANWTVLDPLSCSSMNESTFQVLPDHSILASGTPFNIDIYTIAAATTLTGITGIRLEALTNSSLPLNGPGFEYGNFVLSEFSVSIDPIPEPSSLALLTSGILLWVGSRKISAQPRCFKRTRS